MDETTITLDPDQQAAVRVRDNVVVSAGAGSGKTRVLTERYLDLLRGGARVPDILALTFTRKAAAEMFQRIYRRLQTAAATEPEMARHLARFDEAQISTLDSFCATILRDAGDRFGLPPRLTSDEAGLHEAAQRAALALISRHPDDPVLGAQIRDRGYRRVIDELLMPIALEYTSMAEPADPEHDLRRQETWLVDQDLQLRNLISAAIDAVHAVRPEKGGGRELADELERLRDDPDALVQLVQNTDRRRFPRDGGVFKAAVNRLAPGKNASAGERRAALLPRFAAVQDARRRLPELRRMHELRAELQDEVCQGRRNRGLLSFQEVMEFAVRALREDRELRREYKQRFRYIMIDEFQDNNELQRDLLYLLSETLDAEEELQPGRPMPAERLAPGKLFFVGDEKQSIYRFRGADVSVFRGLAADIAGSRPNGSAELRLRTNYRSIPPLISFYNSLFPAVFGEAREDYEARFEPLEHRSQPNGDPELPLDPPVTLAVLSQPRGTRVGDEPAAPPAETEAAWIAREIRSLVEAGSSSYDRIAVLFRSGSNQHLLERMLRREGVPYHSQSLRSLFVEAPASDLYYFLRLCLDATDREALAVYLRSPLVMLGDDTLVRLFAGSWRWPQRSEHEPDSGEDHDKLVRARQQYEEGRRRIDQQPIHDVVAWVWDTLGYRYAILHRASDHPYLEHLSYLFALAQQYRERPAVEFVAMLGERMGRVEATDELDVPGSSSAVRLMTIHKSKGLEFPVVFVAGLGATDTSHSQLVYPHPELGLTFRLPAEGPEDSGDNIFEWEVTEREQALDEAERKRLLYVACTRAEERLYLVGSTDGSDSRRPLLDMLTAACEIDPDRNTCAPRLRDVLEVRAIEPMAIANLQRQAVPQAVRRTRDEFRRNLDATPTRSWAQPPTELTPSLINEFWNRTRAGTDGVAGDPEGSAAPASASGSVPPATVGPAAAHTPGADEGSTLGTLVHVLLEQATREPIPRSSWVGFPPWARRRLGSSDELRADASLLSQAWDLAQVFLESSLWRDLSSGHCEQECPFVMVPPELGVPVRGTIDLVCRNERGLWVVDYKSNQALDPARYQAQMSVYRQAAAALWNEEPEVILFGLRDGRAHRVPDCWEQLCAELHAARSAGVGWPGES